MGFIHEVTNLLWVWTKIRLQVNKNLVTVLRCNSGKIKGSPTYLYYLLYSTEVNICLAIILSQGKLQVYIAILKRFPEGSLMF